MTGRAQPRLDPPTFEDSVHALLEAIPLAVVATSPDGVIVSTNRATESLFGYSREELNGQPIDLLIPENARSRHREHWARYAAAPITRAAGSGLILTARRRDGSQFPADIGLACLQTASGPRFVAFISDSTERHRAADAARQSQADLRLYLESAPAAIATFDLQMRYLAVSRRFREDYHLGSRDLIGLSHYDVFPEIPGYWRAIHQRCLAGAVERSEGERFVRADGSEQWVRWEIQPWRGADGSIGGIVLMSEDVTAQKVAEQEIFRLNASLEQRVRDRTAELEAANRELESFSYSVSHDLRAPIRGIDGWSLALLEDYGDKLDPKAREYLVRVRNETARLQTLIHGMLRLARVARAEMQRETVDLSSLAESIAARLREAEPHRRLEFAIQPGLQASGDANLLEIALTNLLENAVKFTANTAAAHIEFGRATGAGAPFFVRDNGAGFDMAYASHLFTAFERLHTASQFPGAGIGLATVQRVIHRHGGRVWAEAKPGQGAAFYFTLGDTP